MYCKQVGKLSCSIKRDPDIHWSQHWRTHEDFPTKNEKGYLQEIITLAK